MLFRSLRGTIIVANHPTILDYVLTASMLPEMDCLVKASLRHNFFLKHVIRAADYMSNDGSLETLEEITRRLEAGENILIFPEGTRTRAGVPMKLKRGVAHAALRTDAGSPSCTSGAPTRGSTRTRSGTRFPPFARRSA